MADIANLGFRVDSSGLRRAAGDLDRLNSSGNRVTSTLKAMAASVGVIAGANEARRMADSYSDIQSQLRLATTNANEFAIANEQLFELAQNTRTGFADVVSLYSGIALPLKEAGKAQSEILKFTELVGKGLQVSGSSADEAASTIRQLSQAMASGVLRGDEFNSIMENGKSIAISLADGLGTTTGKLREMAEKGLLKSELVFSALMSQSDKMNEKFSQIAPTMEKTWTTVSNAALLEIGKIDKAIGASAAVVGGLSAVAENISDAFAIAAAASALLAASLAGRGVSSLTSYTTAKIAAASASRTLALADAQSAAASTAAAVRSAEATLIEATARERRIMLQRQDAIATVAATRGTDAYAAAVVRLNAAHVANAEAQAASAAARAGLTASTAAATTATNGLSAAQASATVTGRSMAAASALGSGALAMFGGPAGVAMIAGAGMYYFAEANNEAAKSIELANGQTLNFAETLDYVTDISNEYRTASTARQDSIREEIDNIIKLTNQRKIEAKQQLEYLNSLDAETAKGGAQEGNPFREGANNVLKWGMDILGLDQGEARAVIKESGAQLEALTKQQGDLGKSTAELGGELQKTPKEYEANARGMLAMGEATKKAAEVTHEHGDAIKSTIESLTQRTLAVEHGTLAEQYYIERMKGVTDAEARRVVSGNQYLTYLEEQQSLTKDATVAHGGLLDAYRQKLDDAGLVSADKAFDAAKSSTDIAVDAAVKYRESIEAVTKAAKDAADAINNMGKSQPTSLTPTGSVGAIASGSGSSSSSESAKIAAAAAKHPQVVAAIEKVAKDTGTDPAVMKTMAYIESRFNDKAYNPSSASGVYQFVNGTAKQYGLSGNQFDAEANTRAYTKLLADNAAALKRYGIEVTGANLYLAHQQGAGGLKQIMDEASGKGSASAVIHKNMRGNPSGGDDSTAAGFLKGWTDKYNTLEASVKSATSKTADVSVQAGKVATETAKAVPIWDALNTKTAEAKSLTVEYSGVIESKVVTAEMRAKLEQQYMNGEAQKLIDAADMQAETIGKSGIAIRKNELNQQQFNVAQQAGILNAESALAYAEEEAALRKELASIKAPGMAAQYAAGLSDKTLTKDQISNLTGLRMENQFQGNMSELDGRAEQATMTADAYKRLTMERDGFTQAQIAGQIGWEKEVERLEDARQFADELGTVLHDEVKGGLKDIADTGMPIVDKFIDQLIEATIEAMHLGDALQFSSNLGSGGGGDLLSSIASSLFGGGNSGVSMPELQLFANGDAFHNSVLTKPTLFRGHGGALSVAGEAGKEAVMPMPNGGILAKTDNGIIDLPITRVGGRLAVDARAYADGDVFGSGGRVSQGRSSTTNINVSIPVTIDAKGADSNSVREIQQQLVQFQKQLAKDIPLIVRQAQINQRVRPSV